MIAGIIKVKNVYPNKKVRHTMRLYQEGSIWIMTKKNDTVQFDLAVERFKINSDYIDKNIEQIISTLSNSLYDIENFCMDNETRTLLG